MKKMKTLKISVVIYIVVMLLAACGGNGVADQPADQTVSLDGTSWKLTVFNKNRPVAGSEPTLSFEDGQVSGTAGCNHYGGSYEVDGDKLSFGTMFMTEMWCEAEGVMDVESAYLELLGQAESYQVVDGVLTIFSGPQQTLTFELVE
jgi:heat shock protein HslJ